MRGLILTASVMAALIVPTAALADAGAAMKRVCAEAVLRKYSSSGLAHIDMGPVKTAPDNFSVDGTAHLSDGTTKPFHCNFRRALPQNTRTRAVRNAQNLPLAGPGRS